MDHRWRKIKIGALDTRYRVCELCEVTRHHTQDPEGCPGAPVARAAGRRTHGLTDLEYLACHYGMGPGKNPIVTLARILAREPVRVKFRLLPRAEQVDRIEQAREILEGYVDEIRSPHLDSLFEFEEEPSA